MSPEKTAQMWAVDQKFSQGLIALLFGATNVPPEAAHLAGLLTALGRMVFGAASETAQIPDSESVPAQKIFARALAQGLMKEIFPSTEKENP